MNQESNQQASDRHEDEAISIAVLSVQISSLEKLTKQETDNIKRVLSEIKQSSEDKVNRAEFTPVRAIAYGLVGLIMTGVVGALLATVVKAADFFFN